MGHPGQNTLPDCASHLAPMLPGVAVSPLAHTLQAIPNSYLQHSTDPATSQHTQQLGEMGEALRCGLHLPLEQNHV
jgi:hypothetical protein